MSQSDTNKSSNILSENSSTENEYEGETDTDCGVVQVNTRDAAPDIAAPYEDEPILDGENLVNYEEEIDIDGISVHVLEDRFHKRISTSAWCLCQNCDNTFLGGTREHRCCLEIEAAVAKLSGQDNITCITQMEHYHSLTKTVVLEHIGPLLKDRQGRSYKQKSDQGRNEYLRAVAYRWIVRYIFGFLGWDNTRPLPACVYHDIRSRFPTNTCTGYLSTIDRETVN